MKSIARFLVVIVMASGGLGGYSLTIGRDTIVGMQTIKVVDSFRKTLSGSLPSFEFLQMNRKEPDDAAPYQSVLDACLATMFFEREGYHFSQSKWGAESVPYQFRGLQVLAPKALTLNGIDRAKGIEERLHFEIYLEAFRTFSKDSGWGEWKIERPPDLGGITLVLHQGTWKVASSPQNSYNLK